MKRVMSSLACKETEIFIYYDLDIMADHFEAMQDRGWIGSFVDSYANTHIVKYTKYTRECVDTLN